MSFEAVRSSLNRLPRAFGALRLNGSDHAFELLSADPHSLRVRFEEGPAPVPGTVGESARVMVGEAEVTLGRCRVEEPGERGVRLVPLDDLVDCRELHRAGRRVDLVKRFDQLPLLSSYKQHVSAGFRRFVADLVYDLQVYRSLFDEIDAGLAEESPETRAELRRAMIAAQAPAYFAFFNQKLRELAEQVRGFSKQEHERHGFYFRRQVWDMINASEFLRRTNVRPRGYAGDSIMMQHIYENAWVGDTIFGQLMHKHPLEEPAAQAVRNRRRMIAETLARAARDQGNGVTRLRFMSVACGPAWELRDLFVTTEDCARYECVLLDQDEDALAEAHREILRVEARTGAKVNATYFRHSVRTMLRTADLVGRFGRAHFIYSMGLFDYLSQPVARAVVKKLYQLLEPGGRLVIGNFHHANPSRCYMEYWMDWVLLYRSEEQLLDLAADLPGARAQLSFEDTGSQMFLEVQRTS